MKEIDKDYIFPLKLNTSFDNLFYDIYIDKSFVTLETIFSSFDFNGKICIITDSNILEENSLCYECINLFKNNNKSRTFLYKIPAGEDNKCDETVKSVISFLLDNNFNRDDLLIALGGGIITDLTGFIASIYKRGIKFISIPTSLVAMTDSSIGGKNGINFYGLKNVIGTFNNPLFVYINTGFISSLSNKLRSDGVVEIIKSALVYDCQLYKYIINNINKCLSTNENDLMDFFTVLIYNGLYIKSSIVAEDPYDFGSRHLLNFGHTIGHAIEKCSNFQVSHGQAVAIGIICALKISIDKGFLTYNIYEETVECMKLLGLPTHISQISRFCKLDSCMADLEENILYYIKKDKKQTSDGLKFILIDKPGHGIISNKITEEDILKSF